MVSTAPVAIAATTAAQVITVSAPSSTSTYATVEAWARQPDGRYLRVARFGNARIGSQGMGPTSESLSRTPTGQYKLSQPFGLRPNPGNAEPLLPGGQERRLDRLQQHGPQRAPALRARHLPRELRTASG